MLDMFLKAYPNSDWFFAKLYELGYVTGHSILPGVVGPATGAPDTRMRENTSERQFRQRIRTRLLVLAPTPKGCVTGCSIPTCICDARTGPNRICFPATDPAPEL